MEAARPARLGRNGRLHRLTAFQALSRHMTGTGALAVAAVLVAVLEGLAAGIDPLLGIGFALGVGFVVLVFVDLTVGFSAVVVLAFLESLTESFGVSLAKLAGFVLVAAWLALMATSRVSARSFFAERPGLTYALVVFLGWAAISITWAEAAGEARTSVMRYALNAVLIPIAYTAIRSDRQLIRVLGALLVGATLAGISGIIAEPPAGGADAVRVEGAVGDANELAAALVLSLGVAAAFAANRHLTVGARALGVGSAVVCVLGILLSLSRGGLLGTGAAGLAAVVLAGRWRPRITLAVGGLVLAAVTYFAFFASLPAKERVTNTGGGTGRLDLWTVAERMIAAHPIKGVGTGQFQTSSVHYLLRPGAIERADFILTKPKVAHNTYLGVLAELGAVGGALFLGLIAVSVISLVRAALVFRRMGDERMEILVRGTAVGVIGYLVALTFISENYSKLFWIVLALGPVMLALTRERDAPDARAVMT